MTNKMPLSVMTFDESYGEIPRAVLSMFRKFNVSPADFDTICHSYGFDDLDIIIWSMVYDHVMSASVSGTYRPSRYL